MSMHSMLAIQRSPLPSSTSTARIPGEEIASIHEHWGGLCWPLYIRYPGSTKGRRYGLCLYTFCVIRAVHLNLVPNLTTKAFFRCLKQYVARRKLSRRIIFDTGQTFKGAAKAIQSMLIQKCNSTCLVTDFSGCSSPMVGSIFEQLIKSTNRCLRKVIGQAKLYYDGLITVPS